MEDPAGGAEQLVTSRYIGVKRVGRYLLIIAGGAMTGSLGLLFPYTHKPVAGSGAMVNASPECTQLARMVAGRNHSMLDGGGASYRAIEHQAYQVCIGDPVAFRRMLR